MSYADGRFQLRYTAPADVGALVEQAIREAKDALFKAGQTNASYADGLAEVAARSLASVESAGSAGSKGRSGRLARYRVYVHLSADGSWVGGRGGIPASLAAKFACYGIVQPVSEVNGVPVSVGRKQRIVPDRTRRLIEDRDRGCVFPGCTGTRFLEVHHLDHWADGGNTDLDRQVCLCPHHHDAPIAANIRSPGTPPSSARSGNTTNTTQRPDRGWCSPPPAACESAARPPFPPQRLTRPTRRSSRARRSPIHTADPPVND
jgi:hypothetical protein